MLDRFILNDCAMQLLAGLVLGTAIVVHIVSIIYPPSEGRPRKVTPNVARLGPTLIIISLGWLLLYGVLQVFTIRD